MNLVVSTTFGWNIGDQFVLAGVKAALALGWDGLLRYVYHDRNPERLPSGGIEAHEAIRCGWADALVIAGTPGWTLECLGIYQTAIEHGVPIYMIGIGAGADTDLLLYQVENNEVLKAALAAAPLIICRSAMPCANLQIFQHRLLAQVVKQMAHGWRAKSTNRQHLRRQFASTNERIGYALFDVAGLDHRTLWMAGAMCSLAYLSGRYLSALA